MRGDEHHRQGVVARLEPAQEIQPGQSGQDHVTQHEIGLRVLEQRLRFPYISGGGDPIPSPSGAGQHLAQRGLVIDDKNIHGYEAVAECGSSIDALR